MYGTHASSWPPAHMPDPSPQYLQIGSGCRARALLASGSRDPPRQHDALVCTRTCTRGPAHLAHRAHGTMNRCAAIQRGMYDRTHAGFERLGLAVALRPWRTIATSLTVAIMLTGCVFAGQWEARIEYRDVPRGTEGFSLYDEVVIPLFGLTPRINEFKAYAADGGNVLRKELLLEALTVHERVLELSAATGGDGANVTTYADICVRSFEGGGCKMDNVFLRLALDRPSLLAMEQAEIDARFLAQSGGLERLLGHLEVDEEARTVRATNLRFFYLARC